MSTHRVLFFGLLVVGMSLLWLPVLGLLLASGDFFSIGHEYRQYIGFMLSISLLIFAVLRVHRRQVLGLLVPLLILAWSEHLTDLGVSEKLWIAADILGLALVFALLPSHARTPTAQKLQISVAIGMSISLLKIGEIVCVSMVDGSPIQVSSMLLLLVLGAFYCIWIFLARLIAEMLPEEASVQMSST
ncbi:MAG TPA: hypothetical protein PLS25_03920 [Methanoregulaceae archaeon]|mgnify:CR=1 FL=1|nr:hypothetical protein [Methanoregulaceae archaeon]